MQSFDIELALKMLSSKDAEHISRILPKNYFIEDRSDTGWGYVLGLTVDEVGDEFSKKVAAFLSGLTSIIKWIKSSSGVLRIAVYNDKVTCTINLDAFDILSSFNIKLELTVYPVSY